MKIYVITFFIKFHLQDYITYFQTYILSMKIYVITFFIKFHLQDYITYFQTYLINGNLCDYNFFHNYAPVFANNIT